MPSLAHGRLDGSKVVLNDTTTGSLVSGFWIVIDGTGDPVFFEPARRLTTDWSGNSLEVSISGRVTDGSNPLTRSRA